MPDRIAPEVDLAKLDERCDRVGQGHEPVIPQMQLTQPRELRDRVRKTCQPIVGDPQLDQPDMPVTASGNCSKAFSLMFR